ncbi:MAG: CotH kinase family protein, partial [Fibrobacteraceae bacterium]|nr:CotH kinase family protein [Fibrobacteraceae bacterium]
LYYKLFPKFPQLTKFKSFILRNNGSNFPNDYIRDRLGSALSEGLSVDYQRGRFVLTYYNGKYYGIHDMREHANEYYFETHYGIDPDNINLLKANNETAAGSSKDYISLTNWLNNNSLESNDNFTYLSTQIDIDNFINYMQIELFVNNRDWPGNNQKKWNQVSPQTPWRWFLYDLDHGFGGGKGEAADNVFLFASTTNGTTWTNQPRHTLLFRRLLENEQFKLAFINRMTTLLQTNFKSDQIINQVNELMDEIRIEIPRDQKRWSLNPQKMQSHLQTIKDFAQKRPQHIIEQLQEHFNLKDTVSITISAEGPGTVSIHNLPLSTPSLTITFFKDLPVTITAKPKDGAKWFSWSDGESAPTRIIHPNKKETITAIFK